MSTPDPIRALMAEMADELDHNRQCLLDDRSLSHPLADRARAALAAVPEGEPSDQELYDYWIATSPELGCADPVGFARAVLARWGHPATPPAPLEGEVGELVSLLRSEAVHDEINDHMAWLAPADARRAATLLEQLSAAAPAVVPVPVSEALVKAECALADVAEGERWCDEGDLLQWAERRCAKALANIRPVMKQHQIRTSEWPPLPSPQGEEAQP